MHSIAEEWGDFTTPQETPREHAAYHAVLMVTEHADDSGHIGLACLDCRLVWWSRIVKNSKDAERASYAGLFAEFDAPQECSTGKRRCARCGVHKADEAFYSTKESQCIECRKNYARDLMRARRAARRAA